MATIKPSLYAAGVTFLGFICFALSATAIGLPNWAYFGPSNTGEFSDNNGYFGPWRVCKKLQYNRERCGQDISRFRPSILVYISGITATIGCICFGLYSILSVLQIAMISSRDKVCIKYNVLVIFKLLLAFIGAILSLVAAILFATQTDDPRTGVYITRGLAFYLQILTIALSLGLLIMSTYDRILSRKPGGDPTITPDITGVQSTTYNNPGFRETNRTNLGISVTDSSGRPYNGMNGSMQSMNTTVTTVSNGSTLSSVTRTPLRSSLKKPRPVNNDSLGIQNPGFSGSNQSPTMQRKNSVVKKVRIQTHSTEV